MDVVQKVQNVLKSALDKPPTLTGSMPKIPEHANVEWSNILPSILSGETDAISSSIESNHSLYKLTTEKVETENTTVEHASSVESALNIGTSTTTSNEKKPIIQSDIQTNVYAGFTNNMENNGEKPQQPSQQSLPEAFTEKPMIPVPVITLTEQKLSTLQSVVTESPIFQMLSVIPVQNTYDKEDQSVSSATTEMSAQIEDSSNQTGQFVELTLSKAPEDTTVSQLTSLHTYPLNTIKQTDASPGNKVSQQIGISAITHPVTIPSVSTVSSITDQVVTYSESNEATNTIDEIPSSNANYVPILNKNNANSSEGSSLAPGVTKEAQANGTHNNDEIISQIDATTSRPLSHASAALRPEEASNETTLRSPSTFAYVSRIETVTTSQYIDEAASITDELSINSATPTYAQHHANPRPVEIQATAPMEPLSTQLIDSFSSVMNQIAEAKPSVLSLSSTPVGMPDVSIVNVNTDTTKTMVAAVSTQHDKFASDNANEGNVERVASTQTYATISTRSPSQNAVTTRTTAYSTAASDATTSSLNAGIKDVPVKPATSITVGATGNRITTDSSITTSSRPNVEPTGTTISGSAMSSPVWIQFEKIHEASPGSKFEFSATPEIATATTAALAKYTHEGTASLEGISSVTSTIVEAAKTPSTTASIGKIGSSNRPTTPINEYLDNTLVKLNWSNPVSAIDQVLNTAPLPTGTPSIRPISLPSDTTNFLASKLASGLIAGFATSVSERPSSYEDSSENQIAKNVSSTHTMRPIVLLDVTKPAEAVEDVTQIYKEATGLNEDQQKKGSAHTSTQKPHLMGATEETVLKLNTQAGKSNSTCSIAIDKDGLSDVKSKCELDATSSGESGLTKEAIKSSDSNERVDDSTNGLPLSSLPNKFVSDESIDSTGQSSITATVVTVNPEQLSTADAGIEISGTDKTLLDTNYDPKRKEDREKTKMTEASVVQTDVSPDLSRLPVKVALIDAANENDIGNAANSAKTETLSEKNDSFASVPTQELTVSHEQYQSILGHAADAVNDSNSTLHSSSEYQNNNSATGADASNVGLNTTMSLNGSLTNATFLQNTNRISNVTDIDKNKDSATTTSITPYAVTVTSRTPVQNNQNDDSVDSSSSSSSPSLSTQRDPVVKVVTSEDADGNKEVLPQSSLIIGPNTTDSFSNQDNKSALSHTAQITPINNATNAGLLAENATVQTNAQSNKTEGKPVSSKHSENPTKPEIIRLQLSTLPPNVPVRQSASKPTSVSHKPEKPDNLKTNVNTNTEDKWTLISQQTPPTMTKLPKPSKPPRKPIGQVQGSSSSDESANVHLPVAEAPAHHQQDDQPQIQPVLPLDASQSASGLDVTVKHTSADIVSFAKLCNELAFNFWVATNKGLSTARSLALSPFGMTSLLAMIFLGARGPTSDQMNEVLGLDDVATFNPHLVFQNITDTVSLVRGQGIANAAFVRELFADKMKVRKLMPFYKEQAQQFYEGLVAEVNFATISDLVRRRTNLLIRKQTGGRIKDFVKTNTVPLRSPLAALSANVFQTDCNTTLTSSVGRDGELYFAVSPAVRQRRLIPVPATTWRSGVLAGYEPSIDATAVALGGSDRLVSTIFVLPGQQGHTAPGDTLDRLEQRLVRSAFRDGTWNKLLKILVPRSVLELQVPKFSHRSVINATAALKRMGLDELFSGNADLKGINGIGHRLHLADVLQVNELYYSVVQLDQRILRLFAQVDPDLTKSPGVTSQLTLDCR